MCGGVQGSWTSGISNQHVIWRFPDKESLSSSGGGGGSGSQWESAYAAEGVPPQIKPEHRSLNRLVVLLVKSEVSAERRNNSI